MPDNSLDIMILSFFLTIAAYASFPLILANVLKKPIKSVKYRLICFGLNFVVYFIFFLLGGGSPVAFILWTVLFSKWGLSILNNKGLVLDDKTKEKTETQLPDESESALCLDYETTINDNNDEKADELSSTSSETDSEQNELQITDSTLPLPVSNIRFCRKCGNELRPESVFCNRCGMKILWEEEE